MDIQTCEIDTVRPSTDFPNLQILGELGAKCDEFSAGMSEVEHPKTIAEVLGLMARILGGLCYSGLKELSDHEIEEPEPGLEPDDIDPYECGEPAGYDPDEFEAMGGLDPDEDSARWDERDEWDED